MSDSSDSFDSGHPPEPSPQGEPVEPVVGDGGFGVSCDGSEIRLTFPYHPGWVAAIKRLRRRHYEAEQRSWHVPLTLAPELVQTLEAAGAPEVFLDALRPLALEVFVTSAIAGVRALKAYEEAIPRLGDIYPGLFAHQVTGIEFLLRPRTCRGAILADDMGLGKTRQAIIAAHEGAPDGRILVVCPATVKLHWEREIRQTLGGIKRDGAPWNEVVVLGPGRASLEDLPARWTIINYDMLKAHHARLVAERWACLILDEAHLIKNRQSQRSRLILGGERRPWSAAPRLMPGERVRGIADRAERIMLLTGTPITNRPLDLFALLRALHHPLGDDLLGYAQRYCAAFQTPYGWDMRGASHLEELHGRLGEVVLRRRKGEVLDLPPKLRTYMPVEVDRTAYLKLWQDYVAKYKREGQPRKVPRRTLLAEIAKLRHAAAIAKIPAARALVDTLLAADEKVIVFTCHQAVVRGLIGHYGRQAVKLTGAESAVQRQRAIDAFQEEPEVKIFVGNLQAAGMGIALTAASQVIFVDYSWVPGEHLQAEDRAYRIGQRNAVTITYLSASGTIDEEIERLLAVKLAVVAEAIDGVSPSSQESFLDDLLEIMARPPKSLE